MAKTILLCFTGASINLKLLVLSSEFHPRRASRHVIKSEGQGYCCVVTHEQNDIGDPVMTKCLHCAIVETLRNPARVCECGSHLVDHLLAFICERGWQRPPHQSCQRADPPPWRR